MTSTLTADPAYELHQAREGFWSVRHRASGEIFHARTPPMEEAASLYVGAGGLAELLTKPHGGPLILWDVGLGAAANAMAALLTHEALSRATPAKPLRPLHMVSFETDASPLRLALDDVAKFPYLQHPAPAALARHRFWESDGARAKITWQWIEGSFPSNVHRAPGPPELIFYDLFSGKTHPEAWFAATWQDLRKACAEAPTTLCTYTCSTAARVAMLAAGFYVLRGPAAGDKIETTLARTPAALQPADPLLGAEWLGRWQRSTARFPADLPSTLHADIERRILAHPQFAGLTPHPGGPAIRSKTAPA